MRRLLVFSLTALALSALGAGFALAAIESRQAPPPTALRVLFVGNSLTATNDLPAVVAGIARQAGRRLEYRTIAPGGYALEDHWNLGDARTALASGPWDVVVMQQGPSALPESQATLREWATRFAAEARARGVRPALLTVCPESYRQGALPESPTRALRPGRVPPEPARHVHGRPDRLRPPLQRAAPRPDAASRSSPPDRPARAVGRSGLARASSSACAPLRPGLAVDDRGNDDLTNVNATWEAKKMKNRWTLVALVATLLGLAAAPAQAKGHESDDDGATPSLVAPLTGESLLASEIGNPGTSTVSGTCNPLGTSTFTFTVTGLATGPYFGTFTESGTVTLGPFGAPGGSLAATSFESTFTIDSPAGTVNGAKSLAGFAPTSLGLCGSAAFPTGGADSLHFEGTVSYTATITTPTGSGTDSGESFVNLQDAQVRGLEGFNGFAFAESYTSTAVPVDCDEDDQGDCDGQGEDDDD